LGRGDIKSPKHGSLKMGKGKIEMEIPNEVGIHVEEGRLGGMDGSNILVLPHRFKYDVPLVKIPGDIKQLPKFCYTLFTLVC
jgi:hypothetical protein